MYCSWIKILPSGFYLQYIKNGTLLDHAQTFEVEFGSKIDVFL